MCNVDDNGVVCSCKEGGVLLADYASCCEYDLLIAIIYNSLMR